MKTTIVTGLVAILLAAAAVAQAGAQHSIRLRGEVQPVQVTEVKPEAAGRIKKVHARTGEKVKAGDLLVEIDELISDEAYEKRAATLQRKDDVLAWTKVNAPCSGTVLTLPVVEGQLVSPSASGKGGTTLMTIGDLSKLIVVSHVPELDASKLTVKQAVQITADTAPGEKAVAVISFIAPIATSRNSVKGFEVQALVEKPSPWLHMGMAVQLTIPITAQ
ncbi:efflux RND transporter periplasmic adaptor subunit [Verrucomicrobiota bacterium sgz303538]